jgi:hypothetical protein
MTRARHGSAKNEVSPGRLASGVIAILLGTACVAPHGTPDRREKVPGVAVSSAESTPVEAAVAAPAKEDSPQEKPVQGTAVEANPAQVATEKPVEDAKPVVPPSTAKSETVPHEESGIPLHGSLTSRYVLRKSGDSHDQDLYETFVLDVGDKQRDAVTGHVVGRLTADLDGQNSSSSQSRFSSLADAYDDPVHLLVYEAYIDIEHPGDLAALRIGRQTDYATPVFAQFDGVRAETKPTKDWKLSGGVYGGVPVHLYDAGSSGNSLAGAWADASPWAHGRVRLDWMHAVDDQRVGSSGNDLIGLSVWQRVSESTRVDGSYTRLEDRNRDVRLRATWDSPEEDLTVQASFYRLLEAQGQLALEFDPFFATLQELFPYDQYRLQASKGLGKHLRAEAGADIRRVSEEQDVGTFNHDYDHGWVSLVFLDCLADKLNVTLTGDAWNSDPQKVRTWGLDAGREFSGDLRLSAGSSYSAYKYDFLLDSERDNVRVWYLRLRKKLSQALSFDVRYDYEQSDVGDYNVLMLGATWRF